MFFCSYVFSTVQRYGDFRTPTIPPMGHSAYQTYGISAKIAGRSGILPAISLQKGCDYCFLVAPVSASTSFLAGAGFASQAS